MPRVRLQDPLHDATTKHDHECGRLLFCLEATPREENKLVLIHAECHILVQRRETASGTTGLQSSPITNVERSRLLDNERRATASIHGMVQLQHARLQEHGNGTRAITDPIRLRNRVQQGT
jgi:hypothetical protein